MLANEAVLFKYWEVARSVNAREVKAVSTKDCVAFLQRHALQGDWDRLKRQCASVLATHYPNIVAAMMVEKL